MSEKEDNSQSKIDPFYELNKYNEKTEDWPSAKAFETPRRTIYNGWRKFHADKGCGSDNVIYIENKNTPIGEKYEYKLYCLDCGHEIDESEVLFIGGEWYRKQGWKTYGDTLENLHIPEHRILSLGPNPDQDELMGVLNITRIEQNLSSFGMTFRNESYDSCIQCGKETFLLFDEKCRMCYDGKVTNRMKDVLNTLVDQIRQRNNSFAHKLEKQIDPLSIKNRAFEGKILWRKNNKIDSPKVVEVIKCLQDDSDNSWMYIISDFKHEYEMLVDQDEIKDHFWDTGLYNKNNKKPIENDRLHDIYFRLC